jgi:hypothetical protein
MTYASAKCYAQKDDYAGSEVGSTRTQFLEQSGATQSSNSGRKTSEGLPKSHPV